jgi:hypothetical protein
MNKNILLAVVTVAMLAFSSSASAFFWDNDDWDDPWDDNDWPEFTPMYWMEEFADEMDDDDDDYWRYGPRPYYGGGYAPRPYYGGGYAPRPYYGGGYAPRPYYGGGYYPQYPYPQQPYQYPQQAPVQPAPAPQQ